MVNLSASLLVLSLATFAFGQWLPSTPVSPNVVPGRYIVELSQGSLNRRDGQTPHDVLATELKKRGVSFSLGINFAFGNFFHGASVQIDSSSGLQALAQIQNVLGIYPVKFWTIPLSPPQPPPPPGNSSTPSDIQSAHQVSGIDRLHAQGYLGSGVQVAVIDSGVDYSLAVMGGGFGPGYKVNKGYDFIGDNFTGSSGAVPDPDPMDTCNGHGTAVASVLAGNYDATYQFIGAAPSVNISAYRVISCGGSTNDEVVMQALQRAYNDGNDVINLSLGTKSGWSEELIGVVASRIAAQGVVVVAAAGNDATYGGFCPSSPGVGLGVIDVGSIEVPNFLVQSFNVSDGYGPIPYFSITSLPIPGPLPIFVFSNQNACAATNAPPGNPANYIYVVVRGACAFTTKVRNVQAVGGKYILIVNTNPGLQIVSFPAGVPIAMIGQVDGQHLISQFNSGQRVTLTFPTSQLVTVPNVDTSGLVSSYVSYGPTNDLFMKPNVAGAGGGEVVASYPAALGGWQTVVGTSIGTPLVSGSAALFIQARKSTPILGQFVGYFAQSVFEQTAVAASTTTDDSGPINTLTNQGAGLINAYAAVHGQTYIVPSKLLLNDTKYANYYQTIVVNNLSGNTQVYTISHQPAQTMLSYSGGQANISPTFSNAYATVTVQKSVTVYPGLPAIVPVTFTPPTGLDPSTIPVYTGQIVLQSATDRVVASYQGVATAMYNIDVIDHSNYYTGTYSLPALVDSHMNPQTGPATYNISSSSVPTLEYRLPIGSRLVQIDLVSPTINLQPTFRKRDIHNRHAARRRRHYHDSTVSQTSQAPTSEPRLAKRSLGSIVSGLLGWLTGSQPSSPTSTNTFAAVPIVGTLFQQQYAPRNVWDAPQFQGLYTYTFSSRTLPSGVTVPNGSYRILLRALRLTGDPLNENDYQSWLSPAFNITG